MVIKVKPYDEKRKNKLVLLAQSTCDPSIKILEKARIQILFSDFDVIVGNSFGH